MASRVWLIKEILGILGVNQAGQDLSPEDYERVNNSLDNHLLAMSADRIYSVPDSNNLPDYAATHIAEYLASKYVSTFGLVAEERQIVREAAQEAREALKLMRVSDPTFSVMPTEYF